MNNKIYYAHSMYKYHTAEELAELDEICMNFMPVTGESTLVWDTVLNPSKLVDQTLDSGKAMERCFELIDEAGALVFSTMGMIVGEGVKAEIEYAFSKGYPVYILCDMLEKHFGRNVRFYKIKKCKSVSFEEVAHSTPRMFAKVDFIEEK